MINVRQGPLIWGVAEGADPEMIEACRAIAMKGKSVSKPKQITNQQAMDFFRNYNQGKYPHQRLGQAFVNEFRDGLDWPTTTVERFKLFYQPNDGTSARVIWEQLVDPNV